MLRDHLHTYQKESQSKYQYECEPVIKMRRNDQAVSGDKDCHRMTAIMNSRVTQSAEIQSFFFFFYLCEKGREDGLSAAKKSIEIIYPCTTQ